MKLLIVDDQSSVVQGLLHCTSWSARGFDCVETALNAVDAKASLRRREADVMLCDIEMPMESGLDLLRWVREQGMTTRCIFLTAHAQFSYAQDALRLGGYDYIMQPAPYAEVIQTVERAAEDVRSEQAARELQTRGALMDEQKDALYQTIMRSFLMGSVPSSSLSALEQLELLPQLNQNCWLTLMQPLQWLAGESPWELRLLKTAIASICAEVFRPLEMGCGVVAMPQEQCLALIMQSRVGEDLDADYLSRQMTYLQSVCEQYLHCAAAFYLAGPQPLESIPLMWRSLMRRRDENVSLRSGVFSAQRPPEKVESAFHIPQIAAWRRLMLDGCAPAMEQEACQLLDKLASSNRMNSMTLRFFYQDFMQMLFTPPVSEQGQIRQMFQKPETLELYRNGMKTVPDMKALIHYVASTWGGDSSASDQSVVEVLTSYIAEHLENELRREELAEAVHLNPDYMAKLFKKETGINLKDYIIQQKMQEARSLLCTTSLPISLIAAKVGYSNFAHFSTSYKKMFHRTPQEERQASQ